MQIALYNIYYFTCINLLGYRLPMTWPFLGAVGSTTAIAPTAQATTLTPAQQLVLAPRTAQRRRYLSMNVLATYNAYCIMLPN